MSTEATPISSPGYAGRYTDSNKTGTFLGTFNQAAYGDGDNDGSIDDGALQQAIDTAESRVDLYTGGPYTFSENTNGTVAATNFERWARVLATFELYAKRVPNDSDAGKALTAWYKEAIEEMKSFAGGNMLLPGAIPANGPLIADEFVFDAPTAVGPTVNPDGTTLNNWPRLTIDGGQLNYG